MWNSQQKLHLFATFDVCVLVVQWPSCKLLTAHVPTIGLDGKTTLYKHHDGIFREYPPSSVVVEPQSVEDPQPRIGSVFSSGSPKNRRLLVNLENRNWVRSLVGCLSSFFPKQKS